MSRRRKKTEKRPEVPGDPGRLLREIRQGLGKTEFRQVVKHINVVRRSLADAVSKGAIVKGLWDPNDLYYATSLLSFIWQGGELTHRMEGDMVLPHYNFSPEDALAVSQSTVMAAAWREAKSVYHIHPSLAVELVKTSVDHVPVEILKRLPQWCVFIPYKAVLSGRGSEPGEIDGFWAMMDGYCQPEVADILRIIFRIRFDSGDESSLLAASLMLKETIKDSFIATRNHGLEASVRSVMNGGMALGGRVDLEALIPEVLNLLIYLCSKNAEIGVVGSRFKPIVRRKKGWESKPDPTPLEPRVWRCGWRVGAALKRASESDESHRSVSTGGKRRPHVRRAHWHLYWTGWGRTIPVVKWLSPVVVVGFEDVVTTHITG